MGNHEYCTGCGESDFHLGQPCDPVKKAAFQAREPQVDLRIPELRGSAVLNWRKLNEMFHINSDLRLVKTSNNQLVPEDEPVFILRGRDNISLPALRNYIAFCKADGVDNERIAQLRKVAGEFARYAEEHAETMKQPGITKGR
jgi:hypothetical protein